MSKGNTLPLFSESLLQLAYALLGYLPFMVVGAMAWGASWLLLAAHIQAQVVWPVVLLIAVHVVDQFVTAQRPAELARHHKAMLKDWLAASLHCSVHGEVRSQNLAGRDKNVSLTVQTPPGAAPPAVRSIAHSGESARTTQAFEVFALRLLPDLGRGPLSGLFAARAKQRRHLARLAKVLAQVRPGNDGLVSRQWA